MMYLIEFSDLALCNTLWSDNINVIGEVQDESEHRSLACKFKFYTMYEESISLLFFLLGVQFHTLQVHPEC